MAGRLTMEAVSEAFLAALRYPHAFRVTVTGVPPGVGEVFDVPIVDGTVTIDRTADVRGRCELTLSDPDLYPVAETDGLHVYGTELGIELGIRYPDGTEELASMGRYRVQDVRRTRPGGSVAVTGYDRSKQVQDERFTVPRTIAAGVVVVDAIQDLIAEVYPAAVFHVGADATTLAAAAVYDRDRWDACKQLAESIGYEVYVDRNGEWRLQPVPDPRTATPVWTIDSGPTGVLVGVDDAVTREGVPNGVVAAGEPSDGSDPVHALVTDDDPASPTLWGGPYGHVPRFYSSPLLRTVPQATAAAAAQLNNVLGAFRSVDFQAVPNPALDAGDAVTIEDAGVTAVHVFDVLAFGLSASGGMTGQSRAQVEVGD